jgi:hypothetical protein
MYPSQFGSRQFGTISEYGGHRGSMKSKKMKSDGFFDGTSRPPKLRNRMRPASAPRNINELKSIALKNKVKNYKKSRPQTGYQLPIVSA